MGLKEWRPGEQVTAAHLNETVDSLNSHFVTQNHGQSTDIPTREGYAQIDIGGAVIKTWFGVIEDVGPDSTATFPLTPDTRTDNTYWVRKQKLTNVPYSGSIGNKTYQKVSNTAENDYSEVLEYIVLATNFAENHTGAHSIKSGTLVTLYGLETSTDSTNSTEQTIYWIDEAPQLCYGVLKADWVPGQNLVDVTVCEGPADATPIYQAFPTQMPDVTVKLLSPATSAPRGFFLKGSSPTYDIIAFYYETDNTHAIAMPINKGIQIDGCTLSEGEDPTWGSLSASTDWLTYSPAFSITNVSGSGEHKFKLDLHTVDNDFIHTTIGPNCSDGINIGWQGVAVQGNTTSGMASHMCPVQLWKEIWFDDTSSLHLYIDSTNDPCDPSSGYSTIRVRGDVVFPSPFVLPFSWKACEEDEKITTDNGNITGIILDTDYDCADPVTCPGANIPIQWLCTNDGGGGTNGVETIKAFIASVLPDTSGLVAGDYGLKLTKDGGGNCILTWIGIADCEDT